jgi:hypothetical protein
VSVLSAEVGVDVQLSLFLALALACPATDPCTVTQCYQLPSMRTQLTFVTPADNLYAVNGYGQLVSLPDSGNPAPASLGKTYCDWLRAGGGKPPYTFSAPNLPQGLALNAATGQITGTATAAGKFSVTFTVTDTTGASDQVTRIIDVWSTSVQTSVNPPTGVKAVVH